MGGVEDEEDQRYYPVRCRRFQDHGSDVGVCFSMPRAQGLGDLISHVEEARYEHAREENIKTHGDGEVGDGEIQRCMGPQAGVWLRCLNDE